MKRKQASMPLFFALMFLFNMAANFVHPVTPTIIVDRQLNDYMFGVALAAQMAFNFLFSPFWGKMAGYIGSKTVMLVCGAGYGLGQVFFGLAQTETQFLLARMFAGVFCGGCYVGFLTYTVNCSTAENRGKLMAVHASATAVSTSFGYFVGGVAGNANAYTAVWLQVAVVLLASALFFILCVDDRQHSLRTLSGKQLVRECNPLAAILQCRKFMTRLMAYILLSAGLANLGYIAFEQCFNYFLRDQFGLTAGYNGIIKAALGVISLAANSTLCLWILRRRNASPYMIAVMGMCTAAMVGVIFTGEMVPFIIVNVVFFAFHFVSQPLVQNRVAALGQASDSNLVMGSFNAVKSFGSIFGSALAGVLYEFNARLPFVFGFAAFALATLMMALFAREEKQRAV